MTDEPMPSDFAAQRERINAIIREQSKWREPIDFATPTYYPFETWHPTAEDFARTAQFFPKPIPQARKPNPLRRLWAWLTSYFRFKRKHPDGGVCYFCERPAPKGDWHCDECAANHAAAP